MALTLAQAALLSNDQRASFVMDTIATSGVVLDRLPFETIEGNSFRYPRELALPGAEFRAVNAGYTESTGTFDDAIESLVILGGDADVDRYIQQVRSNLADQVGAQTKAKAKAVQGKFSDTFINGSTAVDANSFNGLKTRVVGGQVLTNTANGAAINTDDNTRWAFFGKLNDLLAAVPGANVIYMNASVLAQFRSAAMRLTASQTQQDELGRYYDTYNGVAILDIGGKADGTAIIPQTETQGTATNASSVYAVRYADGLAETGVCGLTNGNLVVDPPRQLETKPAWRVRLEWYCGMALFGTKAAARLPGVLAS